MGLIRSEKIHPQDLIVFPSNRSGGHLPVSQTRRLFPIIFIQLGGIVIVDYHSMPEIQIAERPQSADRQRAR